MSMSVSTRPSYANMQTKPAFGSFLAKSGNVDEYIARHCIDCGSVQTALKEVEQALNIQSHRKDGVILKVDPENEAFGLLYYVGENIRIVNQDSPLRAHLNGIPKIIMGFVNYMRIK